MPFATTDPPMERARLVAAHLDGLYAVAELADRFGVSRPTVYKWIERYREGGAEALLDRSRARLTQHAQTPPEVEALLVACRRAHPTWGGVQAPPVPRTPPPRRGAPGPEYGGGHLGAPRPL